LGCNLWQKEMRLRRPEDFRRVWSRGRSWAHRLFVLWALPNGESRSRFGITASRRVGNAVERNRARRLLREAARKLYRDACGGWDVVLVARSALPVSGEDEVRSALKTMLERAGLLYEAKADAHSGAQRDQGV